MDLCNCIPGYFVFLKVPLSCSPALPYLLRRARSVYHRAWFSDLCCQRELSWICFFTHKKTINRKRTPTWTLQCFSSLPYVPFCFSSRGTESGWPWPSWLWSTCLPWWAFSVQKWTNINESRVHELTLVGSNTGHCLGCTEILVDHDQKAAGDPVNSFSTLVMQRQLSHILLGRKVVQRPWEWGIGP